MKDSGKMINNMDKVQKYGLIMQNTKVNTQMPKNMEKELYISLMGLNMQVNLPKMIFTDMVRIHGQITEYMWVNGTKIKCMEKET